MPHVSRRWKVTALCTLALTLPVSAGAEWRRVDSPNFVVIGDVSAGELRDVARRFEGFRETLSRVLTERATGTAVPTVVIVFPSDRAFTPFKPTYEGTPIELSGLFVGTRDMNYIALVADRRADAIRVVFHEYAHLVISNLAHNVPAWLGEGLAEYYSTYEIRRGGREALIGRPLEVHLLRLAEARLLPLEQLLEVTRDSPLYNEGERRSIFYSQSWALTHMLLMGRPNGRQELSRFLARVAAGAPAVQAWRDAFGAANIEHELQNYIRRQTYAAIQYTFPEKVVESEAAAVTLTAADAQGFLAEFLIHQRRLDEAAARLADAAKLDAGNTRVQMVSALLGIARRDHARAEQRLLQLGEIDDWLVAYSAGVAIADLLEDRAASPGKPHLDAASRYFARAERDRPALANALARHASLDIQRIGGPSIETVTTLERARSLAPGRHDYVMLQARILAQRGDFQAARNLLGPFLSGGFPPEIREPARRLMGFIVEMEAQFTASRSKQSTSASNRSAPDRPRSLQPVYRPLEPGEQRLEATLERIECLPGGAAIFHLRTPEGSTRATAAQMSKVDFITYREDVSGNISCGPLQTPMPVYVAWRPGEAADAKTVVAIEFVKK